MRRVSASPVLVNPKMTLPRRLWMRQREKILSLDYFLDKRIRLRSCIDIRLTRARQRLHQFARYIRRRTR